MPPPPNPTPGQYLKVTTVARLNGQSGEMTCGMALLGTTGAGATMGELAAGFLARYQLVFAALHAIEATLNAVTVALVNPFNSVTLQSATAEDNVTVGANNGGALPTQVAPVVTKLTGFAGRSGRGRVYIPFIAVDQANGQGELLPAQIPILQGGVATVFGGGTIVGAGGITTFEPVLLKKVAKGAPVVGTPILATGGFLCTGKMGTQRRRGDYGRLNVAV